MRNKFPHFGIKVPQRVEIVRTVLTTLNYGNDIGGWHRKKGLGAMPVYGAREGTRNTHTNTHTHTHTHTLTSHSFRPLNLKTTHPPYRPDTIHAVVRAMWEEEERDFQHSGIQLLRTYESVWAESTLDLCRELVTTKPWWDTVDPLAKDVAGRLVAIFPHLVTVMDEWVADTEAPFWLRRAGLLHQLGYKTNTGPIHHPCDETTGWSGGCAAKAGVGGAG